MKTLGGDAEAVVPPEPEHEVIEASNSEVTLGCAGEIDFVKYTIN